MKRAFGILSILAIAAASAAAQDEIVAKQAAAQAEMDKAKARVQALQAEMQAFEYQLKQSAIQRVGGAVMGPAVKNAPYFATEITESTQTLADGNRIRRENQVMVYRDTEGRVRRESPGEVTIWDPVANASYRLFPQTRTALKLPLRKFYVMNSNGTGKTPEYVFPNGSAKLETSLVQLNSASEPLRGPRGGSPAGSESLGQQNIEGVIANGTRVTSTIDAGLIGNDRPIVITSETWYSPELQTLVKSVHTDPRSGEETFRLANISRAEPPSTLFQVPADYQITDRK